MDEYILIMDEILELISQSNINEKDKATLLTECLFVIFITNKQLNQDVLKSIKMNLDIKYS